MAFDPDAFLQEDDLTTSTLNNSGYQNTTTSVFDPDAFLEEDEEEVEEQGILRQVADIPLGIARGGVTGIKMMTDILGADNAVSKSLAGVEGYMADLMSAQAKEDQQEISRIMKDAEDKGFGEQVKAGIKAFSIAPVDIMSQALGTMAPVVATGLVGSAAKLGVLGMRAVQAGVGAGMGAGMIKGEIYNEVKNELVNSGITEDAAEKTAIEAQSYGGKNLDQILLGAGLGAASTIGAEGIITRILTKQGTAPAAGVVSRVLKGGLTEAVPEAAQAAQEQIAKNVALQREGFDVDPYRGVVAAATMEAVAAAPLGGIAGAVESPAPIKTLAEENLEQTNEIARKVAGNGAPLTASVIQDQAATDLRQYELAKQLSDDLNVDREVKAETQTATTKEEVAANLSEEDLNAREQDAEKLVQQYKDAYFESQDPNDRAKAVEFQGVLDAIKAEKQKRKATPTEDAEPTNASVIQGLSEEDLNAYEQDLNNQIEQKTNEYNESFNTFNISEIDQLKSWLNETQLEKRKRSYEKGRSAPTQQQDVTTPTVEEVVTPTTEDITAVPPVAEAATLPVEQAPLTQQAVAQQVETQPYATQEIIQPEVVRQEPQDGTQVRPTAEKITSDSILSPTTSQEEGQVTPVVSDLQSVASNTATPEQITKLSQSGLVDIVKGQPVINEDGQAALTQAQAPLPKLTPTERRAEIEAAPVSATTIEKPVTILETKGIPDKPGKYKTEPRQVDYNKMPVGKPFNMEGDQALSVFPDLQFAANMAESSSEEFVRATTIGKNKGNLQLPKQLDPDRILVGKKTKSKKSRPAFTNALVIKKEYGDLKIPIPSSDFSRRAIVIEDTNGEMRSIAVGNRTGAGGIIAARDIKSNPLTSNQTVPAGTAKKVYIFDTDAVYGNSITIYDIAESKSLVTEALKTPSETIKLSQPSAETPAVTEPTPAVSETITPAAPTGLQVGQRVRSGSTPQSFVITEVTPQTARDVELGEQYYKIKNERTGEVSVVEEIDVKKIGGNKVRKMAIKRSSLWEYPSQEIPSSATSINAEKLPETFSIVKFKPRTINADIGGGRFNNATESLSEKGVENVIYDPFNRTQEWNSAATLKISGGKANTATINNVLNVIKEPENRERVIMQAADSVRQDGTAYFLIHEGDRSSNSRITKQKDGVALSWQEHKKAESYISGIKKHFGTVVRSGNLITATNPIKEELVGFNNLPKENQKEADSFIGNKGSLWKLENVSVQELMENSMASMTGDTLGDYDIDGLVKSITKEGVKQPITMERNADGSIDLEGNHRVYAAYLAGLDTIPAYVLQKQGILKQVVEEKISKTALIDKDGSIISASDKNHAMLMEESQFNLDNGEFPPVENFGFVTNFGRFVSQKEGQEIARNSQQVQGSQQISGELVTLINEEDNANVLRLNAQGASGNKFNETEFKRFPGIVVTRTNSETLTSHPLYNAAKKFNNVEAAKIIVDKFVDDQMVFDVFANIDQSKPAYIVPVLKGEGDSLNMLPIALAEKLSAASGIPVWGNLIQATSGQSTGAGVNEKTEISRKFMGEAPPTGSQIIIVDDYLATGRTIASLENMTGTASAVSTIASGRYGNQYGLTTQRAEKLLEKAGITKERFYEIYGLQPEQAITGVEAQTYILNGAAGESGLTSRFPVEKISPSNERIRNIANVPEAIELFAGGGLFALGVRGIARPGYVVEADQRIAEFYEEAHGVPVIQDYVQNVNFSGVKSGHLQASPVCKNFSGAKNKNQITEADIQLDKTAADSVSRAIEDTQPNTVSIENVKQYKGSDSYNSIIATLEKNGYIYDANIYKANEFGAPTSRERLIVRAVKKGGVLPEIKKTNKRVSWYDSVKDIVNDLPNHDIFKFRYPAKLMQTLERKGIDLFNVREPLLISGMSGESMRWSNEPAFTFLASPRTLNIIALPGGIVKKVTARAMARMTGVPDSFPLPEDEALAKTIIGNGIPPALTRSVIGDLIIKNQKPEVAVPNVAAEKNQYTFDAAEKEVTKFFGEMPKGIVILNNATDPDLQFKAGYDVKTGDIIINLAYINNSENIGDIISHELGHFIFGDPQFRAAFQEFWDTMTPEKKAEADKVISQFYNNETGEIKIEEKQIRAFMQLIQDSNAQPKWKQILDAIKRWINEKLGTNFQVTDRGALAVLAAAHNRFKSGEQIIREIDSGVIRTAETAQDTEYLAAVESGDMETAQRMVDEAAKKAGYNVGPVYHGTPSNEPFNVFDISDKGNWLGDGAYFSSDEYTAAQYTRDVEKMVNLEVNKFYISLRNPFSWNGSTLGDIYYEGSDFNSLPQEVKKILGSISQTEDIKSASTKITSGLYALGFDGVIGPDTTGVTENFLVQQTSPEQIVEIIKERNPDGEVTSRAYDTEGLYQIIRVKNSLGIQEIAVSTKSEKLELPKQMFEETSGLEDSKVLEYVAFNPNQIKSADPVTYDDAGNVIPLSQRFRATSPDIRRMAAETEKRSQVHGQKESGGVLNSFIGGEKIVQDIVRQNYFDSTQFNDENTQKAYDLLQSLTDFTDGYNNAFAIKLNEDIQSKLKNYDINPDIKQVIGVQILRNELQRYSNKLLIAGDSFFEKRYKLNANDIPLGIKDVTSSNIARALGAIAKINNPMIGAIQAQGKGEVVQLASTTFGTKEPSTEQIDVIEEALKESGKAETIGNEDVLDSVVSAEGKTGVNIRKDIDAAISRTSNPKKNISNAAYKAVKRVFDENKKPRTISEINEGVQNIIIGNLANYRDTLVESSANGLQSTFWKTLSNKENKPGPLGELDQAQNNELANIVKNALVKAGLKGTPPNTKMTDIEKVASILNEQKLSIDKQVQADKIISEDIQSRRESELANTEDETEIDSINDKYDAIQAAWDDAMQRQTDMPVSDVMLKRLLNSEMKELNTSASDIAKLSNDGINQKSESIVDSLIKKIYGVSKESLTGIEIDEDYNNLRSYLNDTLNNLVQIQKTKIEAANAIAEAKKQEKMTSDFKAEQIIDKMAMMQEGIWADSKPQENKVRDIVQSDLKKTPDINNKDSWKEAFISKLTNVGVSESNAGILADITWTQHERNALNRDIEQREKPNVQADALIKSFSEKLAGIEPVSRKAENNIRTIVQQDLRQRPDMGRKEAWKNMLTAKLIEARASETRASIISDLVWKQHEINNMNREIKLIESAAENGSLGVIVEMIKNTPLQQQSTPEWRKEVIRQYLKSAGLSDKQAESAARLYDNIIAEKIAEAKQKAFEQSISKTSPWRDHMSRNGQLAKDALKKVLNAVRTSALDPTQNTESIIAKQNGWTGFSESDFRRIAEIDEILNNKDTDELKKAELMKELNEIISKTKLPVTVKQALAAFYTGQALMGIPTVTVNVFSPLGFSLRNLVTDIGRFALTDPTRIPLAFDTFLDSMRSWYNQTKYAFKNEVYPNDVVEYLNGNNVLKELYNKGKKEWKNGEYGSGMRDMLVGMTQITGRVLSALDQGAISALENQAVNRYAMEAMSLSNIPSSKRNAVARQILQAKRNTYASLIAGGMEKERAGVLADMEMKEQIKKQLSSLNIESEKVNDVINSALNDALLSVGRNRTISMDGLTNEQKRLSDDGMISYLPIKFLEQIASSSAQQGPLMQVFSKMLYGFALVPARAFHNAAWYSPYGFLRIFRDKYQKSKGMESSYSLSLGNELQYRQRLTESIAGSLVMLGLGALVKSSTDDEDDDKFKIVVTGNGPDAAADKQYYDSWIKKWKPYSIHIVMGDTVIPINIGRGGEAIFFPILIAGALDDWNIRNQMNKAKKKPADLNQATVMLGSAFLALAQRGPYAAFGKSLFNANRAGQLPEEVASQAGYFGKTFIPIVGTSLARNISDLINDPIDRSSMSGAIYSNIPIVGPMIGTKALNAFGQPIRADDWGDKLFKLGVPMVFSFPKNTPMNELNELVLSKGDGPTIPTRRIAESRLERPMTNEEFYVYVKTYGDSVSKSMFRSRKSLERMDASRYQSQLEEYSKDANERATRVVKRMSMR